MGFYPPSSSGGLTSVEHDDTLIGDGTIGSPLGVVGADISDAVISVRAATTTALAGAPVYDNGVSGVGATLTRGSNGALPTIDGITLIVGDRVLVKNQSSTLQNGIYEVTATGSVGAPYVLTRTADADTTEEMDELVVSPSEGTQRATLFGQQTNQPVIGTSAITFASTSSLFVTQATTGTQTNGNIPYWTSTARQLRKGDTNFKRNPSTQATTILQVEGNVSRGLTIDVAPDDVIISNYNSVTNIGSLLRTSIDRIGFTVASATTDAGFVIDLDPTDNSISFDIEDANDRISFGADLTGSPNQGELDYYDKLNDTNSRFNVRADSAIMVHATQTTPSIISKRIIVDADGVTVENSGGTMPKFILKNNDTNTEYVSFDPNTGEYIFTLSDYADNAAAITAGLPVGALYYTTSGTDGIVKIVI